MSNTDEIAGVFAEIDNTSTAHSPVDQEVSDGGSAEGAESTETETESKDQKQTTEPEAKETGTTEEGETQQTQTEDKTVEPSKTETSETSQEDKTKTEKPTEQDFSKWKEVLPAPPPEYQGKQPEFNEDGNITNMNAQEYLDYTINVAEHRGDVKNYNNFVEGRALDVAEQIIPDIKTNPNVRKMVENTRIASILSGTPIDTVQAALQVRDLLGISPERLQAAKTEGANSTKASIEIQKNAALETGSTQKTSDESAKITQLQKRVQKGDDTAFAELLGVWEDKGLLK